MAYNLPPAWDPGFALPGNVRDEGLERRAFVTKQMPRGTYDQPSVGYGGYAVPQYIKDEGYGQGTYTTKWQPSGTYSGPRIPNWLNRRPQVVADRRRAGEQEITIQRGLSGIQSEPAMPQELESYGNRAATIILSRVRSLPGNKRRPALKAILDAVDPTLFQRAGDLARQYNAQGMPVAQALYRGLSRSLSAGIAREIVQTGLSGTAPQARSLLGLGCYRASALGAIRGTAASQALGSTLSERLSQVTADIGTAGTPTNNTTAVDQAGLTCDAPPGYKWVGTAASGSYQKLAGCAPTADGSPPPAGCGEQWKPGGAPCAPATDFTCPPPVGFKFVAETATMPGHVERLRVGEAQPTTGWPKDPFTGKCVELQTEDKRNIGAKILSVGPFRIVDASDDSDPPILWRAPQSVPSDMAKYLKDTLLKDIPGIKKVVRPCLRGSTPPWKIDAKGTLVSPTGWMDDCDWLEALGIPRGTAINQFFAPEAASDLSWEPGLETYPMMRFVHPRTGDDWGLYFTIRRKAIGEGSPNPGQTNPKVLAVYFAKIPKEPWYDSVGDWLLWLPAQIGDLIADTLIVLGETACTLLSNPVGTVAVGAGASAVTGAPPSVGIAGANVAKNACGSPPPPPPPPPPPQSSPLLPLAIAGGLVGLALLLTRKPKPTTSKP